MVSWDTRRLSSSGYWIFSYPKICSGDQSKISLLATIVCNWIAENLTRLACVMDATFREKIYIRWCCVDRLNSHRLSDGMRRPVSDGMRYAPND